MQSTGRLLKGVAACALVGLLGCTLAMKPVRMTGLAAKDLTLQILMDPGANEDSVVALDVVAVDDKKTLAEVSALSAQQWFAKKSDLLRMKGKDVKVVSWEFVPGTVIADQHLTTTVGKLGVIAFANYGTKGEHRAVLPQTGKALLECGPEDFVVRTAKDSTPADNALPPALPKSAIALEKTSTTS